MANEHLKPIVLADEARALVNSMAFQNVIAGLRVQYALELASVLIGDPQAVDLHAKLRAIEDIKGELTNLSKTKS